MPGEQSDSFPPDCQLKWFLQECTPCTREDLVEGANPKSEKRLETALRGLCQFTMSHFQCMMKNGLLYCVLNKLVRKWSRQRRFLIPHPSYCTLTFLSTYLLYNVASVLLITELALPTTLIVVLVDDGNVLYEKLHVKVAEGYVSVLFQFKIEELAQQSGPFAKPAKLQKIFPLPRLCSVIETAVIKTEGGPAVE